MKKFNKLFRIGTKVQLNNGEWDVVKTITDKRYLVTLTNTEGHYQRSEVIKFTNKDNYKPWKTVYLFNRNSGRKAKFIYHVDRNVEFIDTNIHCYLSEDDAAELIVSIVRDGELVKVVQQTIKGIQRYDYEVFAAS